MALRINTTPAVLGYNIKKPQQTIQQPKAHVEGSMTHARISMHSTRPQLTIDQVQSFNESGLKSVTAFSDEYVSFAKEKMQESIGRIASQGNQLTDVHLGGDQIAEQAVYNAYDQFYHEFGMVTMPRTGPQINITPGDLQIQVTRGQLNGKIIAQKPIINYQPGKVERYMEQYNSISIQYVGKNVDLKL